MTDTVEQIDQTTAASGVCRPVTNGVVHLKVEDEGRYEELFERLDVNKDGCIDIHDLTEALRTLVDHHVPGHAQKLLENYDHDGDGSVQVDDFVRYLVEHEKALRLSFESLDHNHDGYIDSNEMVEVFRKMGVIIDNIEARRLISRMDRNETLMINWNEWREFFLLHPSSDIESILQYWRHAAAKMDVGEPSSVPDDFTEIELQTGVWWRHLVAGAIAGAVSRTCTAPLDRLKLMLMVYGTSTNNLSIVTGFRAMLHEGGVLSLWRGNGINVLKIAPESALKFMAYEQIKRCMKTGSHELGMSERFIAGSAAGVFSQTAIYPLEVLKTRLALRRTNEYRGIVDAAMKIYRAEGPRSFMRGYFTNMLGIVPYAGIDLCVYETMKRRYIHRYGRGASDPGVFVLLVCGICSSSCGQLVSYPLALVRTKLQANVSLGKNEQSMTGLFRSILQKDGPRGLYRGIVPNFLKVAPAVSISYVVYEHVRKFLGVEMT